jgi:hypothetical protein
MLMMMSLLVMTQTRTTILNLRLGLARLTKRMTTLSRGKCLLLGWANNCSTLKRLPQ